MKSLANRGLATGASRIVLFCLLGQAHGQGTMQIGFQNQMAPAPYYESDMWFGRLYAGPEVLWLTPSGMSGYPDNGTRYLQMPTGTGLEFGFSSFTLFDLVSVDLAELHSSWPGPVAVHVVGYKPQYEIAGTIDFTTDGVNDGPGGAADFQTFTFDGRFQNLWRVQITTDRFSIDNVVIGGVPEPSANGLLLLAAACAFGRSRIKRRRP